MARTFRRSSHSTRAVILIACAVACPVPILAQPMQDRLVVQDPAASGITSTRHVYRHSDDPADSRDLAFDLYLPPGHDPTHPVPTVVFANGVGDQPSTNDYLLDWTMYQDWARLVAAHGMAGVLYNSTRANSTADTDALLNHLRDNAGTLGLRADRVCLWSSSANVDEVYPLAAGTLDAGTQHPEIVCAVIFYGVPGDHAQIRADLPFFYVWSGFDRLPQSRMVEDWVGRAMRACVDLTLVNYRGGFHGFDAFQPSAESRRIVMDCVGFMQRHLLGDPDPAMAEALSVQHARELFAARDYAAAEPLLERAIERGVANAREWHYLLGWCAVQRNDRAAAIPHFIEAADSFFLPHLSNYNAACCAALLGESDRALGLLGRAVDAGFRDADLAGADADLESLRRDPRFLALLERMRASAAGAAAPR